MKKYIVERLSDRVVATLPSARITELVETISKAGGEMSTSELAASLVLSGAALGVDALEGHMLSERPKQIQMFRDIVGKVNELIDSAVSMETTNTLVELRAPLVEKMNELVKNAAAEYIEQITTNYAIPGDVINSDTLPEFLPKNTLLRIGIGLTKRTNVGLYGFHLARKAGELATLKCPCPSCLGVYYIQKAQAAPDKVNEEAVIDSMIEDHGGLDAVCNDFAVVAINVLRKKLSESMEGATVEHDIDPQGAEDMTKAALARMFNMRDSGEL